MLRKVVSGGQTGVDRAGLDAAREAGIPIGGFCPQGRRAEDGAIPEGYPLIELDSAEYPQRTERNAIESDGTLILNKGELTEGTLATRQFATKHGKPCLIVQLDAGRVTRPERIVEWLAEQQIKVLNVAGPRESKWPGGIYADALGYLRQVFSLVRESA